MPTYTNLGIKQITTGDEAGTWGTSTNTNYTYFDTAIVGYQNVILSVSGSTSSPNFLNVAQFAVSDGRNRILEISTGSDLGTCYLSISPDTFKGYYFIRNSIVGDNNLVVFQGTYNSARALTLVKGRDYIIRCNGIGASSVVSVVFDTPSFSSVTVSDNYTLRAGTTGTNGAVNWTFNTSSTVYGSLSFPYDTRTTVGLNLATANTYPVSIDSGTSANTGNSLLFNTSGSLALKVDSSQNVLIGSTAARSYYLPGYTNNYTPGLQGAGGSYTSPAWLALAQWSTSTTTSGGAFLSLNKSNGVQGTQTIVVNGQRVGGIGFSGSDGTKFIGLADIYAEVDGTPGVGDIPGRLIFATTTDGTDGPPSERFRISNTGQLSVASAPNANDVFQIGDANVISTPNVTSTTVNALAVRYDTPTTATAAVRGLYIGQNGGDKGSAYTTTNVFGIQVDDYILGTNQTATIQTGIYVGDISSATTNYGIRSAVNVGTNKYSLLTGTALSQFSGRVYVGANNRSDAAINTTTTAANFYSYALTYTDNTTGAGGTVSAAAANAFGIVTIAASNTNVTYTTASTIHVHGAPTNGANVNPITNKYAVFVNAGNVKVNDLFIGGYYSMPSSNLPAIPFYSTTDQTGNNVIRVTPDTTETYTATVPPAGTTCTLILVTSGTTSYTITFGTGFRSSGTLATGTVSSRYYVLSYVSDGSNLIETGRTGPI